MLVRSHTIIIKLLLCRNRPELLTDKETGLDNDAHDHRHDYQTGQPSVLTDSYGGQGTMLTLHQQQQQDTQHHTLSQRTSMGAISSDEIEEFEDDSSW